MKTKSNGVRSYTHAVVDIYFTALGGYREAQALAATIIEKRLRRYI